GQRGRRFAIQPQGLASFETPEQSADRLAEDFDYVRCGTPGCRRFLAEKRLAKAIVGASRREGHPCFRPGLNGFLVPDVLTKAGRGQAAGKTIFVGIEFADTSAKQRA